MQPDARRIETWAWTVCLVLIAFMLGGVAGYYVRPTLDATGPVAAQAPSVTQTPKSAVAGPPSSLMEAVSRRTRQWKGDASAPVTIVELADFQ